MADTRTYFRVTNGYFNHPKIVRAGSDAGWLDLSAVGYCSENLTDGLLPVSMVARLTDKANALALAKALLGVGRWHETGHDCGRCVQPEQDEYVVHDFLEHQRSADEVSDLRRKRSEAGKRGGTAKANALALARQTSKQNAGKDVAVSVTEEKKTTSSSNSGMPESLFDDDGDAEPMPTFDDFWAAFPVKKAKQDALKAWGQVLDDKKNLADPREIVAGAARYRRAQYGRDPQFTKQAPAWLRGRRWEDEDVTPSPAGTNGHQPYTNPEDQSGYDVMPGVSA